ncbi:MAG TPA: Flp family type IVb pilin [Acidobacteriota bacterium]|jgi:Flp pilus assembly pilin Flp|nr:Flp family type IVb pilin [Acidobacteriota bacterium]
MLMLFEYLKRLRTDERGQTVAEYAILLVLIAIAISVATPGIKDNILSVFTRLGTELAK